MAPDPEQDGWTEWSKYVLKELERLNGCYEGLRMDVNAISTEIATLKVKAGIWGLVGATIPAIAVILMQIVNLN